MKTPLAWLSLIHQKIRLFVAVSGVAFAVLLMFMNLGFLGAVAKTASLVYERLDADVFLISPKAEMLVAARPFPQTRLYQAASVGGIIKTAALYVSIVEWLNPDTRMNQRILVYGFEPSDAIFLMPELQSPTVLAALQRPDAVLIDRLSNPPLGSPEPGWTTEINDKRVLVSGSYTLGSGFAATGTLIMNEQNFRRLFPQHQAQNIYLGLLKLKAPETAEAMVSVLRQRLPNDVLVLTKAEMIAREIDFWVNATSTGFIFNLGVVVSFLVGTAIVYQILATDVREHLPEYATLKAMGYRNRYLFMVILQEATLLASFGFIPGFTIAMGLYQLTQLATNGGLPIAMEIGRIFLVFGLTLTMCALSGLISVRKALEADPADVF
jgi:putative ABC transport system permease protein